jgi:ADP-ribose pyrophosphatase YjhB (NUDIX family)
MAIRNRLNRRIGGRFERFDPNAFDADGDGRVQDATAFERPALPRNRIPQRTSSQNLSGSMGGQGGMWSIGELEELALAQGWKVRRSKKNHPQFITPDGAVLSTSSTPSDGRSYLNFISDLRRNGLVIPRKIDKPKETSGKFSLEQAKPTLRPEDRANALRLVAAKQKPGTKLTLDQLAETLEIDDDDLKNELRNAVNEKFKDYFPSATQEEAKPEERKLSNRERRRRGLRGGSIGAGNPDSKTTRDKHIDIVGKNLVEEAEAAGVSLDAILDDSDMDNDVSWSSNSWSFGKTQKQQAADAVIVRTNEDGEKEVLMIRRKTAPFTDGFALPGGLLDEGETLEQTADREMEEEVGIAASKAQSKRYIGEIEARDWDPRFVEGVRVGGARYDVPADTEVVAASDAKAAEWIPIKDLAAGKYRIGFGHAGWLSLAFEDDSEVSRKLDILARASRHRNQRIIREVNKKRKEAGEKLFTRLGSPNKQYIPEGSGPLGVRKVDSLATDLAKVVTRNPGFFDKKTEEMFIYRATHSSAESAKKFGMTENEFNETLLTATRALEQKIRADIAKKIEESGRKKADERRKNPGLSGSMRADRRTVQALPLSELIERASEEFKLNENQVKSVRQATGQIADGFVTGEIYNMPLRPEIDGMRRELLDSIRISTASGGLPIVIAKPHPMINPLLVRQRDWADVELPPIAAVEKLWKKIAESYTGDYKYDERYEVDVNSNGPWRYQDYLYDLIRGFMEDGKDLPIPPELGIRNYNNSSYRSWIQEYVMSLMSIQKGQALLEGTDGLHDLFGHYGTGRAYDRHGEWANYLAHKDMIEYAPIDWTEAEKEGAHRFWWREYGWLQLRKSPAIYKASESWPINPIYEKNVADKNTFMDFMRWGFDAYPGPISDLLEIIDTGKNGLFGPDGKPITSTNENGIISFERNSKLSGKIGRGKKIKNVPIDTLQEVVLNDTTERIKTRRARSSSLMGAMGIYDSDAEIGAYLEELKEMMGPDWNDEPGENVRRKAERLFSIDISEQERDEIVDELLDVEVAYTDYDRDDFDYEAEEAAAQDSEWDAYLDSLSQEEYEFWKDYNPSGYDGEGVSSSSMDVPLPWEREVPLPARNTNQKKKKKKRKVFGWRKRQEKPSRYINSTKFYGHEHMQEKQAEQLEMFRSWKNKKDWKGLHNAHYDWWAFPIDRGSAAYGDGYNVAGENINELKNNSKYVSNLKELATIYAEAMGWDLAEGDWFDELDWNKGQDPYAQAYGARLYKIARSLQIFGLNQEFDSFLTMVQSLRSDDQLKRRIGKSQYWDNPSVPFNNLTPGTRRATRKMREEMEQKKPYGKLYGGMAGRKIKKIPLSNGPARRSIDSPNDKRMRFIREIDVDNWYIFADDINEYAAKVKSRDIEISTPQYQELMKALAIINSLEALPTDDNGISINMSDEEIKRLRLILKTMTDLPNFFNINEIYEALPTREKPKTIQSGGPDV